MQAAGRLIALDRLDPNGKLLLEQEERRQHRDELRLFGIGAQLEQTSGTTIIGIDGSAVDMLTIVGVQEVRRAEHER